MFLLTLWSEKFIMVYKANPTIDNGNNGIIKYYNDIESLENYVFNDMRFLYGLSVKDMVLVRYINFYYMRTKSDHIHANISELSREMGISYPTVWKTFTKLVEKELLFKSNVGGYYINMDVFPIKNNYKITNIVSNG